MAVGRSWLATRRVHLHPPISSRRVLPPQWRTANLSHMRALVWANSIGAAVLGALVPVVWINPEILDPVIWWGMPAVAALMGTSVLASTRHLRYRLVPRDGGSGVPSGRSSVGWRQMLALFDGVPRRGVALGLSSSFVAWLVGTAAAVDGMTGIPGPDVAVAFVATPMGLLAATALFVAVAMVERDRHTVAPDSPRGPADTAA